MDKAALIKLFPKIILVLILLVGGFIRLNNIRGYQMFLGDQGRDVLVVKRILIDHDMTFLGPTSSVGGFFLGPFYYYLMLPPLAVSNLDPVGPAIMVALFSIATIWLCYLFGKKFYSETAGLIAASVYAVSKLVVEYSRSSWNPNVLPFFSLLLIYAWTYVFVFNSKRKLYWFLLIGSCLGIIIQLHYTAVALFFVSFFYYLIYLIKRFYLNENAKIKKTVQEIAMIALGLVMFLGPFIAFELTHGHQNFNNIVQFVFQNRDQGFSGGYSYEYIIRDTAFRLFLRLVSGGYDLWPNAEISSEADIEPTSYVITLVIWTVVAGFIITLINLLVKFVGFIKKQTTESAIIDDIKLFFLKLVSAKTSTAWITLVVWFIIGVGFWGFYKKSIYDYYYSFMYPLPILIFSFSISTILSFRLRGISKMSLLFMLSNALKVLSLGVLALIYVQNMRAIDAMKPGEQVMRAETVAKDIISHKAPGPYNFALIANGNSDHAYRYFLEIYGHKPTALEESVTTQLMVFCEMTTCEPLGNSLWEVAGFGQATIVGQWESIGWPVYRLEHLPETKYLEGKPAPKGI